MTDSDDSEHWQRVEALFDRVVDLPPEDRARVLDRECAADVELRAEVEELLAADDRQEGFLEQPLEEAAPTLLGEIAADAPDRAPEPTATYDLEATDPAEGQRASGERDSDLPDRIGKYEILGRLGEGGMGTVYKARQQNPRRLVALKVVRGGQFVSESAVRMFQREADTLARLEHPNIGAIYESGRTEGGQHFFAMELVRGETLAEFLARTSGRLSEAQIERRLDLFRSIADAVHYAHQRGVIHRDLKPSNIIITELPADDESGSGSALPQIKILDFGLARITEGDVAAASMVTEVGIIKGTLPYMSPEQARGDSQDLDLRTDVYALGVLLYEMLTGERPYDLDGSLVEAVRVICETSPRPLRSAWRGRQKLDPDLETIVGKALEKEADRRYESAAAFSLDVSRFQAQQPILARPPSTVYQLQKLVARNKPGAALAATLLVFLIGFGIWMNVLWRQSEAARARAEANALLALGRVEVQGSPSSALGYALASLEISDSAAGRRFALEALTRGPTAHVLADSPVLAPAFSPDGRYLAFEGTDLEQFVSVLTLLESGGGEPLELERRMPPNGFVHFDPEARRLFSNRATGPLQTWLASGGELLESRETNGASAFLGSADGSVVVSLTAVEGNRSLVHSWPLEGGEPRLLGAIPSQPFDSVWPLASLDPNGTRLAYPVGGDIYVQELADLGSPAEAVARHGACCAAVVFHPDGETLATANQTDNEVRIWKPRDGGYELVRSLSHDTQWNLLRFDPSGRYLAVDGKSNAWLWDLEAPPDAGPIELRQADQQHILGMAFDPAGRFLVTGDNGSARLWSLGGESSLELHGHQVVVGNLAFDPQGRWLASGAYEVRIWPLSGEEPGRVLENVGGVSLAVDPTGSQLAFAMDMEHKGIELAPIDGGPPTLLGGSDNWGVAFSPDGRYVAGCGGQFVEEAPDLIVWDLESREETVLDAGDGQMVVDVVFVGPKKLIGSGWSGLRLWDLETGEFETLAEGPHAYVAASSDGRTLVTLAGRGTHAAQGGTVWVHDLGTRTKWPLTSHGSGVVGVAVDPDGELVVTGDLEGVVRAGPISGAEPHLLHGHQGAVHAVAVDPRGRWIASGGADSVIRLWPLPQGKPFHTLPLEVVLDRLRGATNYRVVADDGAPDGYRLQAASFAGWESLSSTSSR